MRSLMAHVCLAHGRGSVDVLCLSAHRTAHHDHYPDQPRATPDVTHPPSTPTLHTQPPPSPPLSRRRTACFARETNREIAREIDLELTLQIDLQISPVISLEISLEIAPRTELVLEIALEIVLEIALRPSTLRGDR